MGPSRGLLRDCEIFAKVRLRLYLEAVEEGALEEELVLDVVPVVLQREEAEELVRVVEGTDDASHTGQRHVDAVRSLGPVHDVHCKYCERLLKSQSYC